MHVLQNSIFAQGELSFFMCQVTCYSCYLGFSLFFFVQMSGQYANLWNHPVSQRYKESWKGLSTLNNRTSKRSTNT